MREVGVSSQNNGPQAFFFGSFLFGSKKFDEAGAHRIAGSIQDRPEASAARLVASDMAGKEVGRRGNVVCVPNGSTTRPHPDPTS